MIRVGFLLLLAAQVFPASPAFAHELRPAYLEMRETADNEFAVLWKVPALGDMRLALYLRLPDSCSAKSEPVRAIEGGAFLERWMAVCEGGLAGQVIGVEGLRTTLTDVLARIEYRSGTAEIARLTPEAPVFAPAGTQSGFEVAATYLQLGVHHILFGFDHLLFVLALLLLVSGRWMLVKTITAFTVAHSITLGAATLGFLDVPGPPVEAAIALSIAFVAVEIVNSVRGRESLTARLPWLVAFAFGLLHGLGFAGALSEVGLPGHAIPVALLFFNIGVEIGQLIFIAAAMALFVLRRWLLLAFDRPKAGWSQEGLQLAGAYGIGGIASFWLIERVTGFWS